MALSPIVLFVYNRPAHTRKVLESLKANPLASKSDLFIFADGIKKGANNSTHVNVQQVRRIIDSERWCKNVTIKMEPQNKGLAASIIDGVNQVINTYGRAIVLEDDTVVSEGFLKYMNEALDLYAEDEKVMHIAGHVPVTMEDFPDTFFYRSTSCWGWGTWAAAWQKLELDPQVLLEQLKELQMLNAFTLEGTNDYHQQLTDNIEGKINTWAVKWNASVFLNRGFSLHPRKSLVKNIGFDGTGTNSRAGIDYVIEELADQIVVDRIPIEESEEARRRIKRFFYDTLSLSFFARLKRKLRRRRP